MAFREIWPNGAATLRGRPRPHKGGRRGSRGLRLRSRRVRGETSGLRWIRRRRGQGGGRRPIRPQAGIDPVHPLRQQRHAVLHRVQAGARGIEFAPDPVQLAG
jgi:hypothetical protein